MSSFVVTGDGYDFGNTDGLIVAGGSADGQVWTPTFLGDGDHTDSYAVAYGDGVWLVVSEMHDDPPSYGEAYRSTDGLTWESVAYPTDVDFRVFGVRYHDGKWVAYGNGTEGGTIAVSEDNGDTWSLAWEAGWPGAEIRTFDEVRFLNDAWYGVGNGRQGEQEATIWRATQLDNFQMVHRQEAASGLFGVAFGDNRYVATGIQTPGSRPMIITSTNGMDWSMIAQDLTVFPFNTNAYGVRYYNGLFVTTLRGFAVTSGQWLSSPDGLTWTHRDTEIDLDEPGGIYRVEGNEATWVMPVLGTVDGNTVVLVGDDPTQPTEFEVVEVSSSGKALWDIAVSPPAPLVPLEISGRLRSKNLWFGRVNR